MLNNNTALRLFHRNNPAENEVKPLLNQNEALRKPKDKLLNYDVENPGVLRKNKSQHLRNVYT